MNVVLGRSSDYNEEVEVGLRFGLLLEHSIPQ